MRMICFFSILCSCIFSNLAIAVDMSGGAAAHHGVGVGAGVTMNSHAGGRLFAGAGESPPSYLQRAQIPSSAVSTSQPIVDITRLDGMTAIYNVTTANGSTILYGRVVPSTVQFVAPSMPAHTGQ